jgi:prepilin-type N-terminal cleavage/methylation domain-containing protein
MRVRGYTLLEILVVLALVGLTTAMVGPSVAGWLAAARVRGWQHDLKAAVEGLPLKAFVSGEPFTLDAAALERLVPGRPEALRVELAEPLSYRANGMASGGVIRLTGIGVQRWRVTPVTGEVVQE